MPYYFVAKTPGGKFVGQFELGDFPALIRSGRIMPEDFATPALGTYQEGQSSGAGQWVAVSTLLEANPPGPGSAPPVLPRESLPGQRHRGWKIAAGFMLVVATLVIPWLLDQMGFFPPPNPPPVGFYIPNLTIYYLLFEMFGLPLIAFVLAVVRRTRPIGLGMLLACGLGWLILLSICGGLWR